VNRRQVAKEISSVIFRKELFSSARELRRTKVQNNFNQRDVKRGEKTLNKIFLELMKKKDIGRYIKNILKILEHYSPLALLNDSNS